MFTVDKLEEACQAAATYVLLNPNSEDAQENMKFYKNQKNVKPSFFQPRNEAKRYLLRRKYESQLLNFVDVEFNKMTNVKSNSMEKHENKSQV